MLWQTRLDRVMVENDSMIRQKETAEERESKEKIEDKKQSLPGRSHTHQTEASGAQLDARCYKSWQAQ